MSCAVVLSKLHMESTIYFSLDVLMQHWLVNNLFGLAFAVNAIELIRLNTVSTAAILLGGLFVYDVFWVFGTEVMVSVAKNFEAPIKRTFALLSQLHWLGSYHQLIMSDISLCNPLLQWCFHKTCWAPACSATTRRWRCSASATSSCPAFWSRSCCASTCAPDTDARTTSGPPSGRTSRASSPPSPSCISSSTRRLQLFAVSRSFPLLNRSYYTVE